MTGRRKVRRPRVAICARAEGRALRPGMYLRLVPLRGAGLRLPGRTRPLWRVAGVDVNATDAQRWLREWMRQPGVRAGGIIAADAAELVEVPPDQWGAVE